MMTVHQLTGMILFRWLLTSSMALYLGSSQQVTPGQCAGQVTLESISGDIVVGGSRDDLVRMEGDTSCSWRIDPSESLAAIVFRARVSSFGGEDFLELRNSEQRLVARFSQDSPMESEFVVEDSNIVMLTLKYRSRGTHIDIRYTCHEERKPQSQNVTVFVIAVVVGSIQVLFGLGFLAYILVKQRRQALRPATARQTTEPHVVGRADQGEPSFESKLEILPQRKYEDGQGSLSQCCLCLVEFVSEDDLRILPCAHYFHKECIDLWFASRRARAWTCPLCKADALKPCLETVDGVESHGEGHDTSAEA